MIASNWMRPKTYSTGSRIRQARRRLHRETTVVSVTKSELQELQRYLTPQERAELNNLLATDRTVWRPLAGPQRMAYDSEADELFYGGAAGGGKTDLLIGLALTAHRRSIIFRREYPQLKAIVDRCAEIIGDAGRYNVQSNTWRMRDGRLLELGAAQYEKDVRKYQGRPHDLKCFDELPNFTEYQYLFLSGWLRTTRARQRTRIAAAGNPPTTAEGEWVIRRWAAWLDRQHPRPAEPGELRWYAQVDGKEEEREDGRPFDWKGEKIRPKSRTFIPARLADNPYLVANNYGATLQALPEPLRSQLLYGDFAIGIDDNPWQVIPTAWVRAAMARHGSRERQPVPPTLGVDVARGGDDKTVIARRFGNYFDVLQRHAGASTPDGPAVGRLVVAALPRTSGCSVHVDVIGVGASVYDWLRERLDPMAAQVHAVNVAAASTETDRSGQLRFANLRAEAYWRMREALDPEHGDDLALPDDSELLADLCAPRWEYTPRGIRIEEKKAIMERIGRSPDAGDAVVLALLERRGLSGMDLGRIFNSMGE